MSLNILFVHQNFPGQFKHLAPALAAAGHHVKALAVRPPAPPALWQGVEILHYQLARQSAAQIHPWLRDLESKVIRGEACLRFALGLRAQGYTPDLIIAHPGWGESLFLKQVWPAARLGLYAELHYLLEGADVGFDPEFEHGDIEDYRCRLRMKHVNNLMHFDQCDAALSPTQWQASTFPEPFRSRITVVHDGIDTDALTPFADVRLTLQNAAGTQTLTRADEVVTFVARQLEPYRGYHVFMRALPELLRRRPKAHVLVVGGDGVSYGAAPTDGRSWKQTFVDEVRGQIADADWARVHFLGTLPYTHFINLLRLSTVHVYLTYPFVLSWSLLEAMSVGACVLASDTAPLHEAITHDQTGRLVGFFDRAALLDQLCELLDDTQTRARLGAQARAFVRERYDLQRVCLPRQMAWVNALAG